MIERKLVYTPTHGIGITVGKEESTGLHMVLSQSGSIQRIQQVFFPDDAWYDLLSDPFHIQRLFPTVTYRDGLAYCNKGRVLRNDFDIPTNTMTATVSENETYTATLQMDKNRTLSMRCTCRAGKSCKHCAAALIRMSQLIEKAEKIPDREPESASALPLSARDAINKISQSKALPEVFGSIRALTDLIANTAFPKSTVVAILIGLEDLMESAASPDAFSLAQVAFAADTRIRSVIDGPVYRRAYYWPLYSDISYHLGRGNYYVTPARLPKRFICAAFSFRMQPDDTEPALRYLLEDNDTTEDYTEYFFRYFLEHSADTADFEKTLLSAAKSSAILNSAAVWQIHSLLSSDCWQQFIKIASSDLRFDIQYLPKFPEKDRFALLCCVHDPKQAIGYAYEHLQKACEAYPREAAYFFERHISFRSPTYIRKKLEKMVDALPDGTYFQAFFKAGGELSVQTLDGLPYQYEQLSRYFTFRTEVTEESDSIRIRFSIVSPHDQEACNLDFDENLKTFRSRARYYWENRYGDVRKVSGSPFLSAFLPDYLRTCGDSLQKARDSKAKQIAERREAERKKKMQDDLALLSKQIYKRRIRLLPSQRSSLEFNFTQQSEQVLLLSARISNGRGKFYVIKNMRSFIVACREHETVRYAKGFELTHIPENFDDTAQKALALLLRSGFYDYPLIDKHYIGIPPYLTNDLLETLTGSTILWNSEEYSVSGRRCEYSVSLDNDNIISVPIEPEKHVLFISGDRMFDFNRAEKTVDTVIGSEDLHNLLMFAFANNGCSIAPVLDTFKSDIYPRLSQYIRMPEEKAEEFKLGQIEINAYFDYADGVLSLRSELKKDNVPILADDISSPGDLAVLEGYRRYIDMLGFTPNCRAGVSGTNADAVLEDEAAVLSFFSMDFSELRKCCNVFLSESICGKMLLVFQPPVIRVRYNGSIMQAFAEESEYSDSELDSILHAIRLKKKFVLLSGNRILRLDNTESEEFADTVSDLGLSGKAISEPKQIPVSTALRAFAHEANCKVDDYLVSMVNDIKAFKLSKIPLPDVAADLRSYQKEGFRWMHILSDYNMGGILADDMGLGKTLQVITLFKSDPTPVPSLVVCPKSLVFNWKTEFDRFDPDTAVREIYGTAAEREKIISDIDYQKKTVYITSYDSLRNDREKYTDTFRYLILDEAQYIKNMNAQKSRTVKTLSAAHKFALTGTPIENNVLDLWSIFDFILPGYFEELKSFKHRFETEPHFPETVSRRVAPFILRRTKKDVLKDLPEKYERILSAEMCPDQRKLYEAYKKTAREKIQAGGKAFDILPILMRLRQICVDPSMFADNYTGKSGKIELLSELIPSYIRDGHRILLFSQFVKGLESVEALLHRMQIPYFLLTGDTKSEERIRLVNEFNNGRSVNIFLISLKAGGTGLNLIGADTVIHLDPWWNVAAENQATDRTHRIGQTKNVEVIKIICDNSVEQNVTDLQNRKKDLVDKLISNDDSSVTGATLEDIAFVIG